MRFQKLLSPTRLAALTALAFCFGATGFAADHCVRAGGTGNGADWAQAMGQLPATLTRGDTYWVAAGTYPSYNFNTPAAGETPIAIKKATAQAHGPEAGWQPAYGEAVAVWGPVTCSASYLSFDGVTGQGKSGHGFEINGGKGGPDLWAFENAPTSVTIAHVEMHLDSRDVTPTDAIYGNTPCKNITVSHCHIHDISRCPLLMRHWTGLKWEYNWAARNKSTPESHAEGVSTHGGGDHVFRNSVWEDIEGTAIIVNLDAPTSNWEISGNVFFETGKAGGVGHGIVGDNFANSGINGLKFFNNSAHNLTGISTGLRFWSAGSTNINVQNNIWHGCKDIGFNQASHDHNSYYDCTTSFEYASGAGAEEVKTTGDPFVAAATGDFHLKAATPAGIAIGQQATDPDGKTRGSDGTWDRGAYEFGGEPGTGTGNADAPALGQPAGASAASAGTSSSTQTASKPSGSTPGTSIPGSAAATPARTDTASNISVSATPDIGTPAGTGVIANALQGAAPPVQTPPVAAPATPWIYVPGPGAPPVMPTAISPVPTPAPNTPQALPEAAAAAAEAVPSPVAAASPGQASADPNAAAQAGTPSASAPTSGGLKGATGKGGGRRAAAGSSSSAAAKAAPAPAGGEAPAGQPGNALGSAGVHAAPAAPGTVIQSGHMSIAMALPPKVPASSGAADGPIRIVMTPQSTQVVSSSPAKADAVNEKDIVEMSDNAPTTASRPLAAPAGGAPEVTGRDK